MKAASVEVIFAPDADTPVAYITNEFGNTFCAAAWNPPLNGAAGLKGCSEACVSNQRVRGDAGTELAKQARVFVMATVGN